MEIDSELAEYSYDEDWVTYEAPDHPKAILIDLYHHARDLLAEHGGGGAHLLNRMIFAQQIEGLQAYLADTLINLVKNDSDAMKRLITGDSDLLAKKFSLSEISANAQPIEQEVLSHLRSIVYHNIPKVRALYKIAANVDIFEMLGASKDRLFKAIEYRHDCVHRKWTRQPRQLTRGVHEALRSGDGRPDKRFRPEARDGAIFAERCG
ncbi:hypothetical protein [Bradyrhizobium sp. CCBAU 11386]|uniref:hypothetical protein n=1 Tax=Bradyrhizobium sp. CCBAU 11386 TaxID=1630837 RepID=UPI002304CA0A|nr:hypothetical protein [Bradyrhizobium sp. CCBAU 11386]